MEISNFRLKIRPEIKENMTDCVHAHRTLVQKMVFRVVQLEKFT